MCNWNLDYTFKERREPDYTHQNQINWNSHFHFGSEGKDRIVLPFVIPKDLFKVRCTLRMDVTSLEKTYSTSSLPPPRKLTKSQRIKKFRPSFDLDHLLVVSRGHIIKLGVVPHESL